MNLSKPLQGIIPPLITPLHEDFTLDYPSFFNILEHTVAGGVHGVFILGTTGEFSSLSTEVKNEVISLTCGKINKRIPVLVGITDCSFNQSLSYAAKAADCGAQAVVAAPPFYMRLDQVELINYYEKLADQVELPLMLYNIPSHARISIAPESVKILSEHPNIIGIKDSSNDLEYFKRLCRIFEDTNEFSLLIGPEEKMVESINMGGHGCVAGGANLFPKLYVKLYEAIKKTDSEAIQTLQANVLFLSQNLYSHADYQSAYLKGLKAAMSFEGHCKGILALPLYAYSEDEKATLKKKYEVVEARVNSYLKEKKL
ncbi:dihydrodipicolinate synthase family protein [Algoriphagus halophytocola]|uniref:Dihydrodipicolinate synthase family protein n=1 Tax=Algoriphagus halophytocola TaxID=2991499 RepID=A0ABY6ML19_9BACT|nr:dihydrodipicolinate synthase family protein [Algoriphagus sp. TR-M5]UZD24467.1 dihydrodipicolinate synthase family protein [Algoriphagus sp. TR-M5]